MIQFLYYCTCQALTYRTENRSDSCNSPIRFQYSNIYTRPLSIIQQSQLWDSAVFNNHSFGILPYSAISDFTKYTT